MKPDVNAGFIDLVNDKPLAVMYVDRLPTQVILKPTKNVYSSFDV